MLNQNEQPIYFFDTRYFDNKKFWDEAKRLDKHNQTNHVQSLKDAISRVYRMANPTSTLFGRGGSSLSLFPTEIFFPTEVAVFCLQFTEFEDIKNTLMSCRTVADRETDRTIDFHLSRNLASNTIYLDSFLKVKWALESQADDIPAIAIIEDDLLLRNAPPAQPRASRLSPSFILSCVLAGGTVIAVAMLLGASFGTACLTVAAVGAVATLTLACVGFFSAPSSNASSNREDLEPEAPSRWSSCCIG